MEVLGVLVFIVLAGIVILFASKLGKDTSQKTVEMLWREYNVHDKRIEKLMGTPTAYEAMHEQCSVIDELERRGYDIGKLISEEASARWRKQPMNFENCKKGDQ